ncbi:hypothetical protein B7494_g7352 [Chlorociboria aeruginascens]|nr:hypothetical protein B7494_g7352 [Chlorociboria aeruginascens]
MLPLRAPQTRLVHVIKRNTWHRPARNYSGMKGSSSTSSISKAIKYLGIASVVGVPVWLLMDTHDKVPRLESPPTEHLVVGPGPSRDEVTRIISQNAYSFQVKDLAGVSRYDGAQLASNNPCEDRFIHGKFPSPWNHGNQWMAWAVLDGHAGWQTADLLEKQLIPFVRLSLGQVRSAPGEGYVSDELVQRAITKGFMNLDESIVNSGSDAFQSTEPLQDKVKKLALGYAGSCALLSMYDPATSTLHVACTGDSRAVLGQKSPDGKWEAIPLSVDQTGDNQEEIARLKKEHPGEEEIVKDKRVLGMMVSRAFGDCRWKWPLEMQKVMVRKFYGIPPLTPTYDFRTPPYLTAEPVVTSTKIDPTKPSFLIMATDGMWFTLSNEQSVDLVGRWVESQLALKKNIEPEPKYEPFDFGQYWKGVNWRFVDERGTIQDGNAAVHLIRNCLGGNHHEMIAGQLAFNAPSSRRVRDDITVQVVFFTS